MMYAMIEQTARRLRAGSVTSRMLTEEALSRIRERAAMGAFITVCEEEALRMAEEADRRIAAGNAPLLCGIPMSLKDNIVTAGIRTTAASRMLADFVPPYDAFVWEKLRAQGAVLLGKTNMDEFAMGAGGETSAFGACRHPQDDRFVTGGSSAGSAAAVADGQGMYSLGSDTGGSVRVPAAYCGIVGVKPTYGRISRRGLIAFASSLDQIGVLAGSVADSAAVLAAVVGADILDSTSADRVVDFLPFSGDVRGMRIGICPALYEKCDPAVKEMMRRAETEMTARGASLTEITLPDADRAYAAYYLISACEASSNLARYDGIRYGYAAENPVDTADMFRRARACLGDEVKRRLLAGTCALSADERGEAYDRASRTRRAITEEMRTVFDSCDVIMIPTTPSSAYPVGAMDAQTLAYRQSDAFTTVPSLAGLPALSLPGGKSDGMPLGIQLIAPAFGENILFRCAEAVEEAMAYEH